MTKNIYTNLFNFLLITFNPKITILKITSKTSPFKLPPEIIYLLKILKSELNNESESIVSESECLNILNLFLIGL